MKDEQVIVDTGPLKDRTARRILSEIRRQGAVARVDIADKVGLSPATVTTVSAELISAGLVREAEVVDRPTTRGRPPVRLSLNPDALFTVGAKLSDRSITAVALDFRGAVLGEGRAPLDGRLISTDEMLAALDIAIAGALQDAGRDESDMGAIGLGVPGFIEANRQTCTWSPVLSDAPINIGARLKERYGCPGVIDNDANLATTAESWFGLGRDRPNFLVVTIEHGVGLGVVIDGEVFRGAGGAGGEFGHMKVQADGALCRCGQRGCLEAYVADYALARDARISIGRHDAPLDDAAILERLFVSARRGEADAASIFARAGRMLGLGLANLVNLFDPSLIILSGARMSYQDLFDQHMTEALEKNRLQTGLPAPEIRVHRWGDQIWARGAATLALEMLETPKT